MMTEVKFVAVACRLYLGAFSGEYVFEIPIAGQAEPYVGAASPQYCWDAQGKRVPEHRLSKETPTEGLIAARLLKKENGRSVVAIPDGEVVVVNSEHVHKRPESSQNVPV